VCHEIVDVGYLGSAWRKCLPDILRLSETSSQDRVMSRLRSTRTRYVTRRAAEAAARQAERLASGLDELAAYAGRNAGMMTPETRARIESFAKWLGSGVIVEVVESDNR